MSLKPWGTAKVVPEADNFFKPEATLKVHKQDNDDTHFMLGVLAGNLGINHQKIYYSNKEYEDIVQPDKYFTVKRDDTKKELIFTESTKNDYDKYQQEQCNSRPDYEWDSENNMCKKTVKEKDTETTNSENPLGGRRRRRRKSRKSRKSRRKSRKTKRKRRKSRKTKKRRKRRR